MSCRLRPVINPFRNQTPTLTAEQKQRFLWPGAFLIPVRVSLIATSFLAGLAFSKIATHGLRPEQLENSPFTGYRAFAAKGVGACVRLYLFALGFHKIKICGQDNLETKGEAPILVCNHISPFEAQALHVALNVSFVAAAENYKMPVVGPVMHATQQIKFVRGESNGIKTAILKRALQTDMPRVGLFPEGTTHSDSALISFKPGAFQPGLNVQPVVAVFRWRGTHGIDPSWCGGQVGLGTLFVRLMAQWETPLELHVLPVYRPSAEEKANPHLFADNVRRKMAAVLRAVNDQTPGAPPIVVTEHSVEDMQLQVEAARAVRGSDEDAAVLEFGRMRRQFSFDKTDISLFLSSYKQLHKASGGSGRPIIRYRDFVSGMGVPDSPLVREIFVNIASSPSSSSTSTSAVLRAVKEGSDEESELDERTAAMELDHLTLDLRNFLKAAMVFAQGATESELDQIFRAIDVDNNRLIRTSELHAILAVAAPDLTRSQAAAMLRRVRDSTVSVQERDACDFIEFSTFLRSNPIFFCLFKKICLERAGMIPKLKNEARRRFNSEDEPTRKHINEE